MDTVEESVGGTRLSGTEGDWRVQMGETSEAMEGSLDFAYSHPV